MQPSRGRLLLSFKRCRKQVYGYKYYDEEDSICKRNARVTFRLLLLTDLYARGAPDVQSVELLQALSGTSVNLSSRARGPEYLYLHIIALFLARSIRNDASVVVLKSGMPP